MAKKTGKLLRLPSVYQEQLAALMLMPLLRQVGTYHFAYCTMCCFHACIAAASIAALHVTPLDSVHYKELHSRHDSTLHSVLLFFLALGRTKAAEYVLSKLVYTCHWLLTSGPSRARRKGITKEQREMARLLHRTHMLCLLSRGLLYDQAASDAVLQVRDTQACWCSLLANFMWLTLLHPVVVGSSLIASPLCATWRVSSNRRLPLSVRARLR